MTAVDVSASVDGRAGEITRQEYNAANLGTSTRDLVSNGWTAAQNYARDAFNAANTYLASLGAAAAAIGTIPTIDGQLGNIPTAITALTASFNETAPSLSVAISFPESMYTSTELTHLISQVDQWVQGEYTGLPPAIEQALWDRARAREVVSANKKSQEVLRQFAMRGFSKPPGALAVQLLDAAQEAQDKDSSFSRDVAIKQADLMQSNRRFAFEMAEKIQGALMQYGTEMQRRALDVLKTVQQLTVEIHGHMIQAYGARAGATGQRYSAEAALIRATADIEIAEANMRIESSKANIQALIQKATLLVESIRASAQISGQLAASALAAVNLSGGVHDSSGWSVAISEARSRSISVGESASSNRQENYTP